MPCYHAKPAWQAHLGGKLSFSYVRGWRTVMVPCTTCIGCIKAHAQAWAFRCHLEGTRHEHTAFATLTFDDEHLPFTLDWRRDGQPFLKALRQRANRLIRFFASGEYGSKTHRPHYHFLLYGIDAVGSRSLAMVQDSWRRGQVQIDPVTPARIAYCAGYTDKKATDRFRSIQHADPLTGEVWQPPFIQMSRRPGLGSHARQWKDSWRLYAVTNDGVKIPVPRYLHKTWRDTATPEQLERLQSERDNYTLQRIQSIAQTLAAETIALRKQATREETRERQAQKREFHTAGIRRFLGITPTNGTT